MENACPGVGFCNDDGKEYQTHDVHHDRERELKRGSDRGQVDDGETSGPEGKSLEQAVDAPLESQYIMSFARRHIEERNSRLRV